MNVDIKQTSGVGSVDKGAVMVSAGGEAKKSSEKQ